MTTYKGPIVVIGGGLSGVMAARTLIESGEENVLLLDKGRGLGGRMITREFSGAKFDHGAQFFTAYTDSFKQLVTGWIDEGLVKTFPGLSDGYFGSKGMNALIRHLAHPVDFCVRVRVTKIQQGKGRWTLRWISEGQTYVSQTYNEVSNEEIYDPGMEATIHARAIILTVPVPQALFLLEQGNIQLEESIRTALETVDYAPCLSIMLTLEREHHFAEYGYLGTGLPDPLRCIVDNKAKGISPIPSLTILANEEWSRRNIWNSDEEILERLIEAAKPWLADARIKDKQVKRWTFSHATKTYRGEFLDSGLEPPLLFAGDAFVGDYDPVQIGSVETAALSGIESAKYMLKKLATPTM